MKNKQNKPYEQTPFAEVLKQRKAYYKGKIDESFEGLRQTLPRTLDIGYQGYQLALGIVHDKLDRVYQCGNLSGIEGLERDILEFSENVAIFANPGAKARPTVDNRLPAGDKRPMLTLHQYTISRNNGMSHEEIKAKYRMDSNCQLSGFARWYKVRSQAEKKIQNKNP
jgi:hypothetical protein